MNVRLTKEQRLIKKAAGRFSSNYKEKEEELEMEKNYISNQDLKQLSDLGFAGVSLPEKYGGQGLENLATVLILEELAPFTPTFAEAVLTANFGAIRNIDLFGSKAQKKKYIPAVCEKQKLMRTTFSNSWLEEDPSKLAIEAEKVKDEYVLNGKNKFVRGAIISDFLLVLIKLQDKKGEKIGTIIVEKKNPGVKFGETKDKLGHSTIPYCSVNFDNACVSEENLVVDGDLQKIEKALDIEKLGIAAILVGIAQGSLKESIKYSQERQQFGKDIVEFQAIQFLLADMAMMTRGARLLTYRAASNSGRSKVDPLEASLAICYSKQIALRVTDFAIQIHGGYGFSKEYIVERMFRDAWGWSLATGSTDLQYQTIGSYLLDQKIEPVV